MNKSTTFVAGLIFALGAGGMRPATAASVLGTIDLRPILGNNPGGNSQGLAFNPVANVFYLANNPGSNGGVIYTLDSKGKLLKTLDFQQVYGAGWVPTSLHYDPISGRLLVLAYNVTGATQIRFVEMTPDGTSFTNQFPVDTKCSDAVTLVNGSLWFSCFPSNSIREYTRAGTFIRELSLAALIPPAGGVGFNSGPDGLAPDFSGGLLVVDLYGHKLLDIDTNGNLLAKASTSTLDRGIVLAIDTDVAGKRIFLQINNQTIYILSSDYLVTPTVSFSSPSWTFSARPPGTTSGLGQIFVTNTGKATLNIANAQLTGESSSFSLTNNCPATLGIQHTCNLQFTFKPTRTGLIQAGIQLNDDAPDTPQSIPISGVGAGPALQLSSYEWHFNNHPVGQSSGSGTVFATNTGTAPLHFSSIVMGGANPAEFPITANTCGAVLQPNATCGVTFHFTPAALDTRTASLVFQDDAVPASQVMTLSGQGTAH